jgi:AcrR family transcriptional regulator
MTPTRAEQAARRRAELLAAALKLFAARGFRGTTIQDIAVETGTAPGLVYHYFRSKEELLGAVMQHHSFLPELRRLLALSPDRPAPEVLREVATEFSRMLEERGELLRFVSAESQISPEVGAAMGQVMHEGRELLVAYLQARIEAGELRPHDPGVPARALFWSIVSKHLARDQTPGFEADLVELLLQGMVAR